MNKILIIQTAFLGDVVLATPVASELKRLYPEVKIDFLVKKGNETLLDNNPNIRNVFTFDKSNGKWKSLWTLIKKVRKERYDLAINLHRFGSSGIITAFSGAAKKHGFDKNPFSFMYTKQFPHNIGDSTHEVTRNLALIKEFGARDLVRPDMHPSDADFSVTRELAGNKKPYITMAPASVWFTKQLPEGKWIDLIHQQSNDAEIFLIGGPGDKELCERIRIGSTDRRVYNLCGSLSLLQSAALMHDAKMNYVNDSGPMHLASAVNAPVTVFFCSTAPSFGFGPLSDSARIIEVKGLPCRPCGLHGHRSCPEGHFNCGNQIEVS